MDYFEYLNEMSVPVEQNQDFTEAPVLLFAALNTSGYIGQYGKLMYKLPEDMQFFKRATMGNPCIMGRTTFESLPAILSGRLNIVLTEDEKFVPFNCHHDVSELDENQPVYVNSLEGALLIADKYISAKIPDGNICVIGCESVYFQSLYYAESVWLTTIEDNKKGDCKFPVRRMTECGFEPSEIIEFVGMCNGYEIEIERFDRTATPDSASSLLWKILSVREATITKGTAVGDNLQSVRVGAIDALKIKGRIVTVLAGGSSHAFHFDNRGQAEKAKMQLEKIIYQAY